MTRFPLLAGEKANVQPLRAGMLTVERETEIEE
jgi:hypothetical protein